MGWERFRIWRVSNRKVWTFQHWEERMVSGRTFRKLESKGFSLRICKKHHFLDSGLNNTGTFTGIYSIGSVWQSLTKAISTYIHYWSIVLQTTSTTRASTTSTTARCTSASANPRAPFSVGNAQSARLSSTKTQSILRMVCQFSNWICSLALPPQYLSARAVIAIWGPIFNLEMIWISRRQSRHRSLKLLSNSSRITSGNLWPFLRSAVDLSNPWLANWHAQSF